MLRRRLRYRTGRAVYEANVVFTINVGEITNLCRRTRKQPNGIRHDLLPRDRRCIPSYLTYVIIWIWTRELLSNGRKHVPVKRAKRPQCMLLSTTRTEISGGEDL